MSADQWIILVAVAILAWTGGVMVGILVYRASFEGAFLQKYYEERGFKYRG